jgi:hypothetical protein
MAAGLYVLISVPSKRSAIFLLIVLLLVGASLMMIWSESGVGGWGGTESHGRWRYTPPSFVRLGGWALLLFPIWLPLIVLLIRWMD